MSNLHIRFFVNLTWFLAFLIFSDHHNCKKCIAFSIWFRSWCCPNLLILLSFRITSWWSSYIWWVTSWKGSPVPFAPSSSWLLSSYSVSLDLETVSYLSILSVKVVCHEEHARHCDSLTAGAKHHYPLSSKEKGAQNDINNKNNRQKHIESHLK